MEKERKKKNTHRDKTSLWIKKKKKKNNRRFSFLLYGQRTYMYLLSYDPIHFKKPLSFYNLQDQSISLKRKVPSDIIYTRNNLFHLDPGLFQY